MKVRTIHDLIGWTQGLHRELARCLAHCATHNEEQRAQWPLEYLADHEKKLEKTVQGFAEHGEPKALNTWIYDYIGHDTVKPHAITEVPFSKMNFSEICGSVFELHERTIKLYRYLLSRADIPQGQDLLRPLLEFEEHELMRLAHQSNRIGDL